MVQTPEESYNFEIPEFRLPHGLKLPEELEGSAPRLIPDSVKNGPLVTSNRNLAIVYFTIGLVAVILSPLPITKTISLYLLPLQYLFWIGMVIILIAARIYLSNNKYKKACQYIEEGDASFAKILNLVKIPTATQNDQPITYALLVHIHMIHPETKDLCIMKIAGAIHNDRDTRFRVGDAIPVVWMPGNFEKTVQIYDFLESTKETSLKHKSSTKPQAPLWEQIALIVILILFFTSLIWDIYTLKKYAPIDIDEFDIAKWPFIIGGVVGLAGLLLFHFIRTRERKRLEENNILARESGQSIELVVQQSFLGQLFLRVLCIAGIILIAGIGSYSLTITANAMLDKSPSRKIVVEIKEMTQTTHSFIFREYNMEFRRINDKENISFVSSPDHMNQFSGPMGKAVIRAGRFGWPWVENIEPITPEELLRLIDKLQKIELKK
jgi:energy-converting hydrogenase Eha subunit C